jgi:polyhydroxyalkanoate synthesis repressor PhaR
VIGMEKPERRRGRPPAIAVPATGPRIVKKYGNRRLYDTRASRYINMDELLDLVGAAPAFDKDDKDGVRVVDAQSGEDLTERTLTHALLSVESERDPLVPSPLLRALLRYRRGPRRSDFTRHLTRAVDSFTKRR